MTWEQHTAAVRALAALLTHELSSIDHESTPLAERQASDYEDQAA
ncbi:hypothetical protein [Motilibacter deserti]|nr:hypothetical protein [Motilibacter deserti]